MDSEIMAYRQCESNEYTYNRYVKMAECYHNALNTMQSLADMEKNELAAGCQRLELAGDRVSTCIINEPKDTEDSNAPYYDVLYRLNLSSDIGSCKKAAAILKDYLINNPGSVMGETMLEIIGEQLED